MEILPFNARFDKEFPYMDAETLRTRVVRHNPLDHLYAPEQGVTYKEEVARVREAVVARDPVLAELFEKVLEGPVAYLAMPDRYRLDDELEKMTNEDFREWREYLRKIDPAAHDLLEHQRIRATHLQRLLPPLVYARGHGVGNPQALDSLFERYDALRAVVAAKESPEALDHRTMTIEDKTNVVKAASALARDIIAFALGTVESPVE